MAYASQAQIEAFLKRSLTANESTLLAGVQAATDNWINKQLDSHFGTTSETTRYYDGGERIIDIDPAIEITAIALVDAEKVVTDTYTLAEDLEQEPLKDTVKRWLEKRIGAFPSGLTNIAVTAKFVLSETVPDDIVYLATYLAGKLFGDGNTGDLDRESIEGYSYTFKKFAALDETATMILDQYTDDDILL